MEALHHAGLQQLSTNPCSTPLSSEQCCGFALVGWFNPHPHASRCT